MTRTVALLALLSGGALSLTATVQPSPVHAHGIESSLEWISGLKGSRKSEKLEVLSRFSTGLPASDATVRWFPVEGGPSIELGRTGADGRLTFVLPPKARSGGEIQVDAGPGHRDYLELSDAEPTGSAKSPATHDPTQPLRQAWSRQVSAALIVIGMVGGIGLFNRLRRGV